MRVQKKPGSSGQLQYRLLSPCLICNLVDSSEKAQRREFAATALTAKGHRKCHKNSNLGKDSQWLT
jgi:hypothetical protein